MPLNPYQDLPASRFWSSGVASPVNHEHLLSLEPLLSVLSKQDTIVSAGSCFSQYIGQELVARDQRYLASALSDDRVESFGLGNVYSLAQWRQWLEFALGKRSWSADSVVAQGGEHLDYLLPHRSGCGSPSAVRQHRDRVARELITHLRAADVLIFTIGLTETWRNAAGDVLPSCPGTLIGRFDASRHRFCNAGFEELSADLHAVDALLAHIRPGLRLVFTVSPVPLTATAAAEHVLVATCHSKSVIRAAVGQFCRQTAHASYFPSYELVNHPAASDWRLQDNLRSVSPAGVRYVMQHAFEAGTSAVAEPVVARGDPRRPIVGCRHTDEQPRCEEGMLDAYARHRSATMRESTLFLIGDSHMQALAEGFERLGVATIGGQIMNGSGFSDNRFELAQEGIFVPQESPESAEIWSGVLDRLQRLSARATIITNIGCQSHRVINDISNRVNSPILSAADIAEHFERACSMQRHVLAQLTHLGDVWMVEDPNFLAFLANKTAAEMVRAKNFHRYTDHLRDVCDTLGIGYLDPCDHALRRRFDEVSSFNDLVEGDRFHGTPRYYEYCARTVGDTLGAPSTRTAPLGR